MKTRFLIIIGISIFILISFLIIDYHANKFQYPAPCAGCEKNTLWIRSAEDELYNIGCTEPAINHLSRHSNLLDDSFDGIYFIEFIGLPNDLSQVEFDECVKIIVEKRTSEVMGELIKKSKLKLSEENEQLQRVLDYCSDSYHYSDDLLVFTNDTHSINNLDCKWEIPPRGMIPMKIFVKP